jgi:orotate phosphoribosyltransferase
MDFMAVTVMREAGFEAFDNIAGGETAGIPFAALVAERLALPMTYVRKKPKGYGRNARIEGVMAEGDRVLLVEDLATDGGSKLSFVEAIRETGATCGHTAVIFYYGIYPETVETLAAHGVALHHLCTWWDVLAVARARRLRRGDAGEVESFLRAPASGRRRGPAADAIRRAQARGGRRRGRIRAENRGEFLRIFGVFTRC